MERLISCINVIGVVCFLAVAGCASSGGVPESKNVGTSGTNVDDPTRTLADYLQQIPGVEVFGSGNNISVKIRGSSSFMTSTQPLYVIDGIPAGQNYRDTARMVNMYEVSSIRVLKGADAAIYGVQGGNGVILINTKNGS